MRQEPSKPSTGFVTVVQRKSGPVAFVKGRVYSDATDQVGQQFKRKLGPMWTGRGVVPPGYLTKKTAGAKCREFLVRLDMGEAQISTRPDGPTFAEAGSEWLRWTEQDRKRAVSTVRRYRAEVFGLGHEPEDPGEHSITFEFGPSTSLASITFERVEQYRSKLLLADFAAHTINKRLRIIGGIYKRAQRVWGVPVSPMAMVEMVPVEDSGDFDFLSPTELLALIRAAASDQDAGIFALAGFAGLRLGELRALRWMDLDFAKRVIHIRKNFVDGIMKTPKSHKIRSTPMVDQVIPLLDTLSQRAWFTELGDHVFVNEVGNPLDDSRLRKRFFKALSRADLRRMRFHDLRHSFGTMAVQVWPLTDVKAYMGHSDVKTTMRYIHHVPQHDAADKLSALITEGTE